jgi:hypothetical protein
MSFLVCGSPMSKAIFVVFLHAFYSLLSSSTSWRLGDRLNVLRPTPQLIELRAPCL